MAKASDNEFPSVLFAEQAAAPATPGAGLWRAYFKADGLYVVDDAGTELGPLGVGGGGGGSSERVLLATKTLAADAATISFTAGDIPASGHNHLELVITGRTTQASTSSPIYVAYNGDTTDANYYRQLAGINGTSAYANAQAGRELLYLPGASAAAGQGGISRALIGEYAGTTFFKSSIGSVTSAVFTATVGQHWKNTAAITTIDLTNPGSFKAGTICRLYGLS